MMAQAPELPQTATFARFVQLLPDDAPPSESATVVDQDPDVIGQPRSLSERRGRANGSCSDLRAVGRNRRPALKSHRAPPFDSARSLEADSDVMQTTPMGGAARCSLLSPLRMIRSSSFPSVQRPRFSRAASRSHRAASAASACWAAFTMRGSSSRR